MLDKKIIGMVLAGGKGTRIGGEDKGLVFYQNRPLVSYSIDMLRPLVDTIVINANRNLPTYKQFGFHVITDENTHFDGPLAGILAVLNQIESDLLLIVPCDSPLMTTENLKQLLLQQAEKNLDICVASDNQKLHPLFLVIKTHLKTDLAIFLNNGGRKVQQWIKKHHFESISFDNAMDLSNFNYFDDFS